MPSRSAHPLKSAPNLALPPGPERITYRTFDDVEFWFADGLLEKHGDISLERCRGDQGVTCNGANLLIHADSVWSSAKERQEGIDELLARRLPGAVAVHGYHLTDDQLQQLRDQGVPCSASLNEGLIEALVRNIKAR